MSKKKYYAIKNGKGVKNKIVETWSECKALVLGYPAIYKSFKTKDEANEYLGLKVAIEEKEPVISEVKQEKDKLKRKKRKNEKVLKVYLDIDTYEAFIKECEKLDMSEDMIIKNMIKEWLC